MKSETNITETTQPQTDETPEAVRLAELQVENAELRAAMRLSDTRARVTKELAAAGARSPELIFEVIKGELEFDEDGGLANGEALLRAAAERYPEQFGAAVQPSIDAGAGSRVRPVLTREALSKMKPAEIAELDWQEVKRVLAG